MAALRFLRRLMQNRPPAARRSACDVFRPVIQINNFVAAFAGHLFHRLVDFRVRLHRADFVGKNVAVEIFEERKIPADMFDGQVVGVGKNIGLETAPPQFGVQPIIGGISVKMSAKYPPNSPMSP